MSDETTRDEILAQYVDAMGQDLGEIVAALYHRVAWLHMHWALYRQLFARSDRRIALLNDTAGFVFSVVQRTLFNDVVLDLARLTGSPRSAGKDNLTLLRIADHVPDPELHSEVSRLAQVAVDACKSIRDRRNRQLAHDDLSLALATSADPLPGISRADIESALLAVRELLNSLQLHFCQSTVGYEYALTGPSDGDALVHYLHQGLKAEREREQRIISGTFTPEDLEHGEEV
jgi:hypothetical protein